PLTQFDGTPEALLEECSRRINLQAPRDEQDNLLAVSQVLAGLRFQNPELLSLLGGKRVMIESPVLKQIIAESKQDDIAQVLEARFGTAPSDVTARLRKIRSEKRLGELIRYAAQCPDLEAFRERLLS